MEVKMDWKKFFALSWKNFGIAIIVWVIAVIVHNFWYGVFGFEEGVFFIIAVFIVPLYLIISIIYTLYTKMRGK
jgi:hypothetical protein